VPGTYLLSQGLVAGTTGGDNCIESRLAMWSKVAALYCKFINLIGKGML